ncbi:MAG TPA: flagellar basal-body rod protein FlgG [Burkholderiaceae bacterium]|jgi:flagellar basal-body rod protein FlgG|nr:flagellar basal-body rod protein FlgG [Burkholderiaceae bacterium]
MINSLQIAKTGMQAQQTQLDVISHNLANVATSGFKRGNAVFEDLIYQNLRQVGANSSDQTTLPTGLQLGLGVRTVATARSYTQGNLQQTGNNLDVAINGNGFFQVEMPDGTTAYTRDGSFKLSATGELVTSSGYRVLPGVTIQDPATRSVTIAADGTVTAVVGNNPQPQPVGTLELATFVNPAGLEPRGQNMFSETPASGNPTTGAPNSEGLGPVMQGYLEQSNVSVVQELVNMIQTQRAYEMNSKAIQTSDQMLQRLAQL